MADIDTVLERLVTDAAFRGQLGSDPAAALAGYDLTADDLQLLASSLDDTDSGQRGVEQRTSKSAVLGLLASLTGGGGGGTGEPPRLDGASKDSAYLGDAAPGGETDAGMASYSQRYRGLPSLPADAADAGNAAPDGEAAAAFMKLGDIKGEVTEAPEDATDLRKVSGQKKYNNIVLKRGADTSAMPDEQFAPAEEGGGDPDLAFKQGWPVKWQGANVAPGETDAPPLDTDQSADLTNAWPKKVEIGALKAGDTGVAAPGSELGVPGAGDADPAAAGDFDGDAKPDLTDVQPQPTAAGAPDAREMTTGLDVEETKQPGDFLTIEDE